MRPGTGEWAEQEVVQEEEAAAASASETGLATNFLGITVSGSVRGWVVVSLIDLLILFVCCSGHHRRQDNGRGTRIVLGLRVSPSMKLL